MKKYVVVGIVFLFVITSVTPLVIGFDSEIKDIDNELEETLANLRYMCTSPDGFDDATYEYYKEELLNSYSKDDTTLTEPVETVVQVDSSKTVSFGPMDSPWPMKCHDTHHTGRSPNSTADNPLTEKWRYHTEWIESGIIIGDDGSIYFGSFDRYVYALYPSGILKWKYKTDMWIWSSPAIDEDGTVYIGSWDGIMYAINPDGSEKWRFSSGDIIDSSPAIAEDGTIYFGTMGPGYIGRVYAVNHDGTEKWHYDTGYWITADPAIGDDGTIYIGSGDHCFYALYPNGTLRWCFPTGDAIRGSASIANDGTIYIGSWDDYLYALYPNGTMKWRHQAGSGTESNPSIGEDGTIYVGGDYLYAIYPNGTRKWTFDFGENIHSFQSSPAICSDGIIYIGTHIGIAGGEILAVNPDGTERWRKTIANDHVDSSPCIGDDGSIYIGSSSDEHGYYYGYLYAFGENYVNNPPNKPTITGETQGYIEESYEYTFTTTDPDDDDIRFYIEWGDDSNSGWIGPYNSGDIVTRSHTWSEEGDYTIRAKAKDIFDEESEWGTLEVTMPVSQQIIQKHPLINWFLQHFQILSH